MSSDSSKKPWPMAAVAAAIAVFIVGYTFLTLTYRKPNKPYEPAHDLKVRVNTARLLAAGYQRLELAPERPAEPVAITNNAFPAPGGIPAELRSTLVSSPLVAAEVLNVQAPGDAAAAQPYRIRFHCAAPDDKQQLGTVDVYVKGEEIVITPTFERLGGGLQARTRDHAATVTLPAGSLKPGSYRVTMIGERSSRAWTLHVR